MTSSYGAPWIPTRRYTAANFHDLVDIPLFVGQYDVDSMQIGNKTVRMASWPKGSLQGAARTMFWDHQKKMLPAMGAIFNNMPFDSYTTFIIFDSTSGGGSALEHQSSHVGIYTPLLCVRPTWCPIVIHSRSRRRGSG